MSIHSSSASPSRPAPAPEEAEVLRVAAREAEDAGDFRGAIRLVRRLPSTGLTRRWLQDLEGVAAMGENDPGVSTWLVRPAVRWARDRPAGEVLVAYARLLLITQGVLGAEREKQLGLVAATDPVVLDAGLFDGGLFQGYLSEALHPALAQRAGPVGKWADCPPSVWRLAGFVDGVVLLHGLWGLEEVRCLPWPAAERTPVDTLLFGRLVPVAGVVDAAFALPPLRVDQRCAVRLLRARKRRAGPEERLRAVARFRRRRDHEGGEAAA